jgi:hypothetical protein
MLFPAAAFAVHQLRYELGYGGGSGAALAAQGHGYQNSLAPWVVLLVALAFGAFLVRLARAAGGRGGARRRPFLALFGLSWVLLLATYAGQELLEGVFAVGHPAGLGGVIGHGGWWAVPLAALAATLVALLLTAGAAVLEAVARLAPRPAARTLAPLERPVSFPLLRRSPLAGRVAGRAPPAPGLAAA